jgi:hypothetical protein
LNVEPEPGSQSGVIGPATLSLAVAVKVTRAPVAVRGGNAEVTGHGQIGFG